MVGVSEPVTNISRPAFIMRRCVPRPRLGSFLFSLRRSIVSRVSLVFLLLFTSFGPSIAASSCLELETLRRNESVETKTSQRKTRLNLALISCSFFINNRHGKVLLVARSKNADQNGIEGAKTRTGLSALAVWDADRAL